MHKLIRICYNLFFTLSWPILLFSLGLMYKSISLIVNTGGCDYNKREVKIETYEASSLGDGGNFEYSIGYIDSTKIKINGILQIDSFYYIWNCANDDISYLVKSNETSGQFKNHKKMAHFRFLGIIVIINIVLFALSWFFGRLVKKHKITNNVD